MKRNNIHPANKKRVLSQRDRILKWLLSGKTITTIQAITKFGCTRLSARIREIKDMGHVIDGDMVPTKLGTAVKKYRIIQYQPGMSV